MRKRSLQVYGGNYGKHKPADRLLRAGLRDLRRQDRNDHKRQHPAREDRRPVDSPVHLCVREKGLDTCADCGQMDGCPTLGQIAANSPFVLENLKQLKRDDA